MLFSSFLSNVTVVTIGLGKNYTHIDRPQWVLDYVNHAGLRDEDVLVVFDGGDTFFTGPRKIQRALAHFIATTAPTAASFDPAAVRHGDATAPILFTCDAPCFMPQIRLLLHEKTRNSIVQCLSFYRRMWMAANAFPNQRLVRGPGTTYRYLSAGGLVARVWALRAATPFYYRVMSKVKRRRWWCDNTIWSFVYVWSIWQNPKIHKGLRLQYGMVSLDYNHSFFLAPHEGVDAVPAIFHLPGPLSRWTLDLPRLINLTSWVHDWNRSSHSFVFGVRRSFPNTLVKVYNTSGHTNFYRYGDICPVKQVTRLDWLTSPQPK
ncbi:hypothetical protein LSM04_008633 [Trypanosoma melophagium]|uniref:uncharacterized protein n=2 Tax=Trypanosoma melophagium TaxID=715481 RepID=UPI003519E690|nr:hypothetical protein LSM04_008633 [Trypanosoma melophagium]